VAYLHSTFRDNPFISYTERKKILSYEPNEHNTAQGTADDYMWRVYGLGERTSRDGLVVKKWTKYSIDPDSYDLKVFGMDFGYANDPTACTQLIINKEKLYLRQIIYETGLLNTHIYARLQHVDKNCYIACDNENKSVDDLRLMGLSVIEAVKGPDSVRFGIAKLNSYEIFVHEDSHDLMNELYNYCYTTDKKTGNSLNIPIDKFNHAIDSVRYGLTLYR
jgi:phage terminase large subunit